MQLGGSLMDTLTLPGWLLIIDELLQLAATKAIATAATNIKRAKARYSMLVRVAR